MKTPTLSDQDIRDIVRLLGAVAGSTSPLLERRRELMEGLVKLVDADTWMWVGSRTDANAPYATYFVMDGGWLNDAERTALWHCNANPELLAAVATGQDFTVHGTALFNPDHPGWGDGSIHRKYVEPTGIPYYLLSFYPLAAGCISGLGVHRRASKPPFTPREQKIVHLITGQLDWLHRAGSDVPANSDDLSNLTPRQREILVHLLGGDSRKQVAQKLGLSLCTVSDHIACIYRHLKVHSNTELLAKFLPRQAT